MDPKKRKNKLMTAKEAIATFVNDGDHISIANFLHSTPFALIHEVIRQGKKDLIVWSQSGIEELEQLVIGGCTRRVYTAFNFRPGGESVQNEFDRALNEGRLEIEDYSNFTVLAMLMAGAQGYTFAQVLPALIDTDIYRITTFTANKFKVIKCPYTGKDVLTVPAANPDVALIHVQRADKFGNAQYWGSIGNSKWAALACKRIIVSAEEIVDNEVIRKTPQYTLIPGFRVDAVVHAPWGAHPTQILGYYDDDLSFRQVFFAMSMTAEGARAWIKEWVLDIPDRTAYIEHYIEKFGKAPLDRLTAKRIPSGSVNSGSAYQRYWDENMYSQRLGMDFDSFVKLLEGGQ